MRSTMDIDTSIKNQNLSVEDTRRIVDEIKTLLSIYEQDIDADVLKKAFEATCKKRSTENLKEEAPKIMAAVSDDAQLHTLWKSYQKKYPYAVDISYNDIMESTILLNEAYYELRFDDVFA